MRSASSRALRAKTSKSWPSTMASSDFTKAPSRRIRRSPAFTGCASFTAISATTPPSGCCTTWRFCDTSIWPEATTAPAISDATDQTPKPSTRMAAVTLPTITDVRAERRDCTSEGARGLGAASSVLAGFACRGASFWATVGPGFLRSRLMTHLRVRRSGQSRCGS